MGFMAVLKYTGNLNKAFFVDWFKQMPADVTQRPAAGNANLPHNAVNIHINFLTYSTNL